MSNDLITAGSEIARMRNEPVMVQIKALAWATQKIVLHRNVCQDHRSSYRTSNWGNSECRSEAFPLQPTLSTKSNKIITNPMTDAHFLSTSEISLCEKRKDCTFSEQENVI
jgi:hypothetical protein